MKKLIVMLLSLVFLVGCGSISLNESSQEVLIDVAAAEVGYRLGKVNQDKIDEWVKWSNRLLLLDAESESIQLVSVLSKGFDKIVEDSYERMQMQKLIKLFDMPDIQPPDLPFLSDEYIKQLRIIVNGFRDGLMAAKKIE